MTITTATTVPGARCAELLFEVGLTFPSVVHALMDELGFTPAEATDAAREARSAR
jgi:hypothetical protein